MHHPAKAWKIPFSMIVAQHNVARVEPKFNGGAGLMAPANPLDYWGDPTAAQPLGNSRNIVRDQRMSGGNAILWRDPSMIL